MAEPIHDQKDDYDDGEASKSNKNKVVPPKELEDVIDDYNCQTPTSDDHKIKPRSSPPPAPRKILQKRRRRSSDDGTSIEFFEITNRQEVNDFFRSFSVRVSSSSSSSSRKRRSHSI